MQWKTASAYVHPNTRKIDKKIFPSDIFIDWASEGENTKASAPHVSYWVLLWSSRSIHGSNRSLYVRCPFARRLVALCNWFMAFTECYTQLIFISFTFELNFTSYIENKFHSTSNVLNFYLFHSKNTTCDLKEELKRIWGEKNFSWRLFKDEIGGCDKCFEARKFSS